MPQQGNANRRTALLAATQVYSGSNDRTAKSNEDLVIEMADKFLEWLEEESIEDMRLP